MAKETFIMMSLDEDKSKELAKVIGNYTSRKILDYLGNHEDVSEAKLSKELNIPVSTVHYNVKHLAKAGLIESKAFKWSEKGKKVELYNVAKKLIVIAPKGTEGIKERLKSFIPVTLVAFLGSAFIYLFQNFNRFFGVQEMKAATLEAAPNLMRAVPQAGAEMADEAVMAAPQITQFTPTELNYALWFFIGSMFAIIISFLYSYWKIKK